MTFKARSRDPGYPTFEAMLIGFLNMMVSVVSALILYAIIGHMMVTRSMFSDFCHSLSFEADFFLTCTFNEISYLSEDHL